MMDQARSIVARLTRSLRRNDDIGSQGEAGRRHGCEAVIRQVLRAHGPLATAVCSRTELEALVEGGIEPRALRARLQARIHTAPSLCLGTSISGRPVRMSQPLRMRHLVTPGRTGTGKTTLMTNSILQDIIAGRGVGVIALERELLHDEIEPFMPEARWDDVVAVDPGDVHRPVSFNPLRLRPGEDLDRRASFVLEALRRTCTEESVAAPRLELIVANAVYLLLTVPGSTLDDVELLLNRQDDRFRRWALAQCPDERTRAFWEVTYPSFPRDAHLSTTTRLGRLLRGRAVRRLLCQRGESLDVRQLMDEGRVVLVQLSDGVLGPDAATLLAQLFASEFQLAAMSRADQAPETRRPFFLYVDEAQRVTAGAERSYEAMFSRCRKYMLSLHLAFQHLGQMPEPLVRDLLSTSGSIIAFGVGGSDARRLSREMVGERRGRILTVAPDDLVSLPVGHAMARLGRTLVRLRGLPPLRGGSAAVREEILSRSRQRYGVVPSEDTPRHLPVARTPVSLEAPL